MHGRDVGAGVDPWPLPEQGAVHHIGQGILDADPVEWDVGCLRQRLPEPLDPPERIEQNGHDELGPTGTGPPSLDTAGQVRGLATEHPRRAARHGIVDGLGRREHREQRRVIVEHGAAFLDERPQPVPTGNVGGDGIGPAREFEQPAGELARERWNRSSLLEKYW